MKKEILRVENLNTSFMDEQALLNLRINLYEGEVLGIIGLNGSGKTTLVKVLSGLCPKDSGLIYFDNRPVDIQGKKDANRLGIYAVQKNNKLIYNLTVAENIYIVKPLGLKNMVINEKDMKKKIQDLLRDFNLEIQPDTKIDKLTEGQQVLIGMLKAYTSRVRLIILDNIIELCSSGEKFLLIQMIKKLKDQGISFIITSYKFQNELNIFDRIAVIRDGQRIKILHKEEFDEKLLTNLAVGHKFNDSFKRNKYEVGEKVLELYKISVGEVLKNISFTIGQGEILGICDLEGQSAIEIIKLLTGAVKSYEGSVFIDSQTVHLDCLQNAVNSGIGIISERFFNRQFFLNMTAIENLYFPIMKKMSGPLGYISNKIQRFMKKECRALLNLTGKIEKVETGFLSKDLEYKILLNKWILKKSKVIIIDNPTLGADIVTKQAIYSMINRACEQGIGIILITSDISEMINLSNRIIILKDSEIRDDLVINEQTIKYIYEKIV